MLMDICNLFKSFLSYNEKICLLWNSIVITVTGILCCFFILFVIEHGY